MRERGEGGQVMGPDIDCPECGVYQIRPGVRLCGVCETAEKYEDKLEALRAEVAKLRAIVAAHYVCAWCDDVLTVSACPPECITCNPRERPEEDYEEKCAEWAETRATIEAIIAEEPQR